MNIIITGASKGMGKAMTEAFAAGNNNIFICARTAKDLSETAIEIEKKYPASHIQYAAADLSTRAGVSQFVEWIAEKADRVDILVNNAGSFIPGSVHNEEEGALEKMIEVNLYSAYHLTRALLPGMMARKSGHIFNICSIASLHAYSNGGAYSISKFALMGFSKNLREELKPYNIKVTSVYPGAVYTSSWEGTGVSPERIMESNDIASLIVNAASLSPNACVEDIIIRPVQGDLP